MLSLPTEGIVEDVDEEEDLLDSKFEKMDDQEDIHTALMGLGFFCQLLTSPKLPLIIFNTTI